MKALLDTNVLIDYLAGIEAARSEIERHESPAISLVTWMEVLVGADDDEDENRVRKFLEGFDVEPVTPEIAEEAVRLRRSRRIRLPDAIIWATARVRSALLVTRNTRDFPDGEPGIRVPYR